MNKDIDFSILLLYNSEACYLAMKQDVATQSDITLMEGTLAEHVVAKTRR